MFRPFFFSFLLACLLPLLFLSPPTTGQVYRSCGTTGNYAINSTYESNLNLLLPSLASNASLSGGFLNTTVGRNPNQIHGLAMCRGDKNSSACRSCLNNATQDAPQLCPYNKSATIIYDECLLRYSDRQFFSTIENSERVILGNVDDMPNRTQFEEILNELMDSITSWAVYNTTRRFATGETNNSTKAPVSVLYALVQCTEDLSSSQCQQCLQSILVPTPTQLEGKQGGRVITASCYYRFELYKFYDGPSTLKLEKSLGIALAPAPIVRPVSNPAEEDGKGNKIVFASWYQ